MQIVQTSGQIHAGHDHGILGKWIETLTENLPVSEQVHEFITHFITDSLNIFLLLFVVMTAVYFLSSYINMRLRLSFALALCLVLLPFLSDSIPSPTPDFLTTLQTCGFEIIYGIFDFNT